MADYGQLEPEQQHQHHEQQQHQHLLAGAAQLAHAHATHSAARAATIARLLVTADVLSGLSSGLSVRFFPLFFKEALLLGPVAVNAIYVVTPLLTALANWAAGRVAHSAGFAQTALGGRLISLGCLCAIIALQDDDLPSGGHVTHAAGGGYGASGRGGSGGYHGDGGGAWVQLALPARRIWILALYCLRCITLYSARPLTRAILMGVVRREERGRWQAFESVTSFGWSGSAALGGLLIDRCGYRAALCATGALQLLSIALLVPLPSLTPASANGGTRWRSSKWAREAASPLIVPSAGARAGRAHAHSSSALVGGGAV
jgi:hypothetical protein